MKRSNMSFTCKFDAKNQDVTVFRDLPGGSAFVLSLNDFREKKFYVKVSGRTVYSWYSDGSGGEIADMDFDVNTIVMPVKVTVTVERG